MRILWIMVALLSILACAAKTPFTVEEYADWCGQLEVEDEESSGPETWGDMRKVASTLIREYGDIIPPDELVGLHRARLKVAEFIFDKAKEENANQQATLADLFDMELLAIGSILETEEEALAVPVRNRLVAAGCINGPE